MACNCERKKRILKKLAGQDISRRMIYMDYNATTPVLPECLGAFERSCRNNWGNPSNCHPPGARAWEELEDNRKLFASWLKTKPEDIHFCSSGSEAIFAGIAGLDSEETLFISTVIEHSAVLANLAALPKERVRLLKVDGEGRIDLRELGAVLAEGKQKRKIILYSPVNHETGGIQDYRGIFLTAREYGASVFFDAVQCAARAAVQDWRPYCDIFALSSHKLYAPKGCGLLAIPGDIAVRNYRAGGGQEKGLFPGTENTPGIAAFAAAAVHLSAHQPEELRALHILTGEGLKILENLPCRIHLESPQNRAPGILCLSLPEITDMDAFVDFLYSREICVSRFSACSDEGEKASEILLSMGRPRKRAETSLRISTGLYSKRDDYFALAAAIKAYFLL